jgi:hypothetical protein
MAEFTEKFHEVKTPDQAKGYIMELVRHVEEARESCNVRIPGDPDVAAKFQQQSYRRFMIKYGQTLGALTTLCHTRTINDVAYDELRKRVEATLMPTTIGALSS